MLMIAGWRPVPQDSPGRARPLSPSSLTLIWRWRAMQVKKVYPPFQDRVKELEEMVTEQRRMLQKQTERIAELEEDNNIYAEEVSSCT